MKIIDSKASLAKILKQRRKDLSVTQKQVADFCNLSHNGISQIELANKSIRLDNLIKISRLLGMRLLLIEDEVYEQKYKEWLDQRVVIDRHQQEIKTKKRLNTYYSNKYGISLDEYEAMCSRQSGKCYLCNKEELGGKRLAVDHNHETGKVRGLLCRRCNTGLGHYEKFRKSNSVEKIEKYIK